MDDDSSDSSDSSNSFDPFNLLDAFNPFDEDWEWSLWRTLVGIIVALAAGCLFLHDGYCHW
jgi:hypothetical protein